MSGTLPVIQALWIGDALSPVEQLCVKSFLDHGHEFHLYTYGDVANVPAGAVIKDAGEIIAKADVFKNAGSYAGFSDWFRFEVVHKNGGFYVDMDVICLKPFDFAQEIIFGEESGDHLLYNSAVMTFPAGHPAAAAMAAASRYPDRVPPWGDETESEKRRDWRAQGKKRADSCFGELGGPWVFTRAVTHFGLAACAVPPTCFMLIPPGNWSCFYDRSLAADKNLLACSYAAHLWNEMARRTKWFNKNARFDAESLFERLKRRHGITIAADAPLISHEMITRHKTAGHRRLQEANMRKQEANMRKPASRKRKENRMKAAIAAGLILSFAAGWWAGQ